MPWLRSQECVLRQTPWCGNHSNDCPSDSLPSAADFQIFQSRSCILKCSYADCLRLEKVKIALLEGGIAKVLKKILLHADLNWETELNCHLPLFRAANVEKQGEAQNIFSCICAARERSPVAPSRNPGSNARDTQEKRAHFLPHSTLCSLRKPNQEVGEATNTWFDQLRSAGLPGASLFPGICSGAFHLCSLTVGRAGTPQLVPRRTLSVYHKSS